MGGKCGVVSYRLDTDGTLILLLKSGIKTLRMG